MQSTSQKPNDAFATCVFIQSFHPHPSMLNSQSLRTISTLHHDLQQAENGRGRKLQDTGSMAAPDSDSKYFPTINITEGLGRLYLAEETTISSGVSLGSVSSSGDNSRHLQCLVPSRPAVSKKAVIAPLDAIKLKLTPQLT